MKRIFTVFIIFILLCTACHLSKKDIVSVKFKAVANCDSNGMPKDSSVLYFPIELFHDTLFGFFDGSSIYRLNYGSKKEFASMHDRSIESLKDTFEIVTEDTSILRMRSYLLFKMKEAVLYDHYLNKNIYRLTPLCAFQNTPLTVTIEKFKDSVVVTSKKLNKPISYPFITILEDDDLDFTTPVITYNDKKTDKHKIINNLKKNKLLAEDRNKKDSLNKINNNCDYYLIFNQRITISNSVWDSLEIMIDSAKFWKSKTELSMGECFLDGSRWIFEGHSENGYQIRIVNNPNFKESEFKNHSDPKDYYAKIFKFIMMHSHFKNKNLY